MQDSSKKNKTVLVAMSGGVDSSVAAVLLKEKGYHCIGATMQLLDKAIMGDSVNYQNACCSLDSINDARQICAKLGMQHHVFNFSGQFKREVMDNFSREYLAGRTPNPCVLCNKKIKWEALIEKALEMGADYIATGHYANIHFNEKSARYELHKGKDQSKDQSYALWGIKQEYLARTLFPLGMLDKSQVRAIAREHDLITAHKSESMDICFVPHNDYKSYLKKTVPGLEERLSGGEMVDTEGNVLGQHRGYPFFTIGQRRGIGKGFGKAMYVIGTDAEKNRLIIGEEKELLARGLTAKQVNYVSIKEAGDGVRALVKIRYNDRGRLATVYENGKSSIRVLFDEAQKAITPGQSAVFYDGERLLGGGIIDSVEK